MTLQAIDLFCGAGGFALGMKRAGIEIIRSLDYDPAAIAVHRANLGEGHVPPRKTAPLLRPRPLPPGYQLKPTPRRGHIAEAEHAHLVEDIGLVNENAPDIAALNPDIIFGGPPCQPYSLAGDAKGDKDLRSILTDAFAITVVCARPKYFVMENVKGIVNWEAYKRSIRMLRQHGYGLTEVKLDASYYGNAQGRERWICAGCLDEGDGWLLEYLHQYKSPRQYTVGDVLGADFGSLIADCLVDPTTRVSTGKHYKLRKSDQTVLAASPADARLFFCRPGGADSAGVCRSDQPAPTITGKSTQGIGKNYLPKPGDPIDLRKLAHPTFAQFSQLAGFPDDWIWQVPVSLKRNKDGTLSKATEVTDTQIKQMLGNSVAPTLAECIGRAILDHAADEIPGPPSSKSPEAAHEMIAIAQPAEFKVPAGYEKWLCEDRGLIGKRLTQEISNLKRVKRYVAARYLETARQEVHALELAPSPAFRALVADNRSTLRKALRTFAEWQDGHLAVMRARTERMRLRRAQLKRAAEAEVAYEEHLDYLESQKEDLARIEKTNAKFFARLQRDRSHDQRSGPTVD